MSNIGTFEEEQEVVPLIEPVPLPEEEPVEAPAPAVREPVTVPAEK